MRITIPGIKYKDIPILWEHHTDRNTVVCLYELQDGSSVPAQAIKSWLQKHYPQLPFVEGTHQSDDAQALLARRQQSMPISRSLSSHSILSSARFDQPSMKREVQSSGNLPREKFPRTIDELIPYNENSTNTWRKTLVYLSEKFHQDSANKLQTYKQLLIQSESSLCRFSTYQLIHRKLPFKREMMREICELYDEHFMSFMKIPAHHTPIKEFFISAICEAMEHEGAMKKGINEPEIHSTYQLEMLAQANARYCLRALTGLIDDTVPIEEISRNTCVMHCINASRKAFQSYTEKEAVLAHINNLVNAMVSIMLLEYRSRQSSQKQSPLDGSIDDFCSARLIIHDALAIKETKCGKNQKIENELLKQLRQACTSMNAERPGAVISPDASAQDLFLSPQLARPLGQLIAQADPPSKDKEKIITTYCSAIIQNFVDFVSQYIDKQEALEDTVLYIGTSVKGLSS
ncbi:MAG: hypothetical protein JJT82_00255 [Legionellaceae bacterium]|nr:hypothetical protein [Legionellaceae bacterium]